MEECIAPLDKSKKINKFATVFCFVSFDTSRFYGLVYSLNIELFHLEAQPENIICCVIYMPIISNTFLKATECHILLLGDSTHRCFTS